MGKSNGKAALLGVMTETMLVNARDNQEPGVTLARLHVLVPQFFINQVFLKIVLKDSDNRRQNDALLDFCLCKFNSSGPGPLMCVIIIDVYNLFSYVLPTLLCGCILARVRRKEV